MSKEINVTTEINEVYELLQKHNYIELYENLKLIQDYTFSSTEMILKLVSLIKEECSKDIFLNNKLKSNLNNLLEYCTSIGLQIK